MAQQLLGGLMELDSGPQFRAKQRSTAERANELNAAYAKIRSECFDQAERIGGRR